MATLFDSTLKPDATIAANVQGWASWFELVVTSFGWTVTSDTGQTLPSSLGGATGQFQKLGYRIYKMNDAFTADNPIYMRVDYGSGSPSPRAFGMWTAFGTGTDGAGNLTGLLWDGQGWGNPPSSTLSNNNGSVVLNYPTRNYASGDNSRFVVGMFVYDLANTGSIFGSDQICFSLERTRDANGAYTGDGILITYNDLAIVGGGGQTGVLNTTKYLICNRGGRAQPPLEKGLSFPFLRHSPAYSFDGTTPCAIHSHFRGVAQQPGTNIAIFGVNDLAPEGQCQIFLYGENHVYQHLKYMVAAKAIAGPISVSPLNDGGTRIAIRYD